jgi:SWIM zinc finger
MTYVTKYTPRVIKLYEIVYRVESLTRQGQFYSVIFKDGRPKSCTCPSYEYKYREQQQWCKHMLVLLDAIEDKTFFDATKVKQKLKAIPEHVGFDGEEYTF